MHWRSYDGANLIVVSVLKITKHTCVFNLFSKLRNAVHDLDYGRLQQIQAILERLKGCKGSRECTIRTRPMQPGMIWFSCSSILVGVG